VTTFEKLDTGERKVDRKEVIELIEELFNVDRKRTTLDLSEIVPLVVEIHHTVGTVS